MPKYFEIHVFLVKLESTFLREMQTVHKQNKICQPIMTLASQQALSWPNLTIEI